MDAPDCSVNCIYEMQESEVVMFVLENCSSCVVVKDRLNKRGILYTTLDLEKYDRVKGYDLEIIGAPTILVKKNGDVVFVM